VIAVARSLIALLVAALPEAQRKKAMRKRRLRPIRPSHSAELQYLAGLIPIVEDCRAAGDGIAAGLKPFWPSVHDETAPGADRLLEQAAQQLTNAVSGRADLLARLAARKALQGVDETLAKNLERAVGVDITGYLGADTEIGAALAEAVADNVALIKSIPTEYLEKVGKKVNSYFATGKRWEQLAEEIERIGNVTYNRARAIARDQASKLNSSFNEIRQVSVGIKEYDWSTSNDERVRPTHQAMNGQRCKWSERPSVGGVPLHPGEDYLCRCVAVPVISFDEVSGGGIEEKVAA
jgi:SPP1 gp7 family putative phage head morphogenesis protein